MADPASIIGILGVCMQFSKEIVKYSTYFKHAPKDGEELVAEVVAIEHVLETLRTHLHEVSSSFERTSVLFFAVNGCRKRLEGIHDTLRNLISNRPVLRFWERLVWPFERSETKDAVLALHRFAQIFHFALTLDGIAALSLSQHDALEKIQANFSDLHDILDIVKQLPDVSSQLVVLTRSVNELVVDRPLTQLLDTIPCLPYYDRHRDLQITRMEGAGSWVLDVDKFVEWRTGLLGDGTLWCNGAPGAGKTYISSVVIDHLQELTTYNNSTVLYFYFDYKLQTDQTPLKFIQTLLQQLLSSFYSVPREAEKLFQTICKKRLPPSWNEMKATFLDICNHSRDVFIVLDALDECDKESNRAPIREFIKEVKKSKARLLVTSRPYPADIDELLGSCSQVLIEASERDIRSYILDRIARSTQISKMIDAELREEIVKSVSSKAQGMFLLPALQMNNLLGQTTRSQIKKVLQSLPNGLGDNLLLTIERIKAQHPQSNTRANLALQVLMWLSTVRRPLTAQELQHAIAVLPEKNALDDLTNPEFFIDCCFGLVVIDEMSIIKLVHFSVSEFLETRRDELFPGPHSQLALSCLSYVFARSENHDATIDTLPADIVRDWHFLAYSTRYFGIHAARGFNATVGSKLRGLCSSPASFKLWVILLKYQIEKTEWNEERDWLPTATLVANGQSLIHIAATYGLSELARDILAETPSAVTSRDENGDTPLMIACASGELEIVELFLQNPVTDVNVQNRTGQTALLHALKHEHVTVVQALFNSHYHLDINSGSPFLAACKMNTENRGEVVARFLDREDLDVNAGGPDEIPWSHLARTWELTGLKRLLANSRFDPWLSGQPTTLHVDFWNYHKNTDYDYVSFGGSMTVVPAIVHLLEADSRFHFPRWYALELIWPFVYYAFASLEPLGYQEYRILDWMPIWDDDKLTWKLMLQSFLKEQNISIDYRDSKGFTFLHFLAQIEPDSRKDESRKEMMDFLLQTQDPDPVSQCGKTPLHVAAQAGRPDIVEKLLSAGANPLAVSENRMTVLHFAAKSGNAEIIETLLNRGVDIHAKTNHDQSVWHFAAEASELSPRVVQLFDEHGLDINAVDIFGLTPLHEAAYGVLDVVGMLLEAGADPGISTPCRGSPLTETILSIKFQYAQAMLPKFRGEFNQLDQFGMSMLDYLVEFKPGTDLLFGFKQEHWAFHRRTPPDIQRRHVLQCFRNRLDQIISLDDDMRKSMTTRSAFQLLKLGDEDAARTLFEVQALPESKSGTVYFPDVGCEQCYQQDGVLFKCKTCPLDWLCGSCMIDRDPAKDNAPQCFEHDFMQVPGDDWKDIPCGKVNRQGQTLLEFLIDLHERYWALEG